MGKKILKNKVPTVRAGIKFFTNLQIRISFFCFDTSLRQGRLPALKLWRAKRFVRGEVVRAIEKMLTPRKFLSQQYKIYIALE